VPKPEWPRFGIAWQPRSDALMGCRCEPQRSETATGQPQSLATVIGSSDSPDISISNAASCRSILAGILPRSDGSLLGPAAQRTLLLPDRSLPHASGEETLLAADDVAIDRCRPHGGMAEPFLNEMRRHVGLEGMHSEPMPQSLRHRACTNYSGNRHHLLHPSPCRSSAPAPDASVTG